MPLKTDSSRKTVSRNISLKKAGKSKSTSQKKKNGGARKKPMKLVRSQP